MSTAMRRLHIARLDMIVARARLLLDLAVKVDDADLPDLLMFAAQIDGCVAADTVTAFRAAQAEMLQAAQAEIERN